MVPMAKIFSKYQNKGQYFNAFVPGINNKKAFTVVYKECSTLPSLDNIDANIQCSMHASTDTKIDRTLLTLR